MSQTKYALFTDLHLGVHQNSLVWHKIALDWADWFIAELKSKKIKNIIFTGDFFHSRSEISVNTIHAAAEFLDKFKDFEVLMIPGNHDCYYKDKANVHSLSILKGYSNITIFDSVTSKTIGKHSVTFCPWGFNENNIPEGSAIFGHFEIETFRMNAHKLCEKGTNPRDLLQKAPLIFSGHFHLNEEREYDEGKIIYVGSPFQLDFGERECKKGYYVLDFDDNITYNFYENNISPVHKKFLVSELQNNEDLKEHYKNNFIKIVIDKNIDQKKIDEYINVCNGYSPLSLIIDPLVNYSVSIEDQNECDLSGVDVSKAIVEFVNMLDIEEKDEVIKHTLFLYNQIK